VGLDGGYEQRLASGLLDGTGPVFRIGSGFRLDKPSFWESLPGSSSTWVDLTGPSDPVVLSGCYSVSGLGGNELLVTLKAYNRLELDVEDIEVQIRLVGPIRAERREATWPLPKLLPTEAAQHTIKLVPTGYGLMQVHCRVLLPVGQLRTESHLPSLHCQPLNISLSKVLRPPAAAPENLEAFLHMWTGLPLQAELSAMCVWPEVEGLLLVLSALARQPLACCGMQAVPVVYGVQAAYLSSLVTSNKDMLAIMLVAQMLPEEDSEEAPKAAAEGEAAAATTAAAGGAGATATAAATTTTTTAAARWFGGCEWSRGCCCC